MRDSACATWRFEIYGDSVNFAFLRFEVKGKDRILIERYLHSKSPWLAALYNLGSGSWLARANDAAAQIAANVRVNVQLDSRHAASTHTTAPINRTRPSPRKLSPDGVARARKHIRLQLTKFIDLERMKGWVDRNKVPPPGVELGHVTRPSTNRARRRAISLIRPITPLPLRYVAERILLLAYTVKTCTLADLDAKRVVPFRDYTTYKNQNV